MNAKEKTEIISGLSEFVKRNVNVQNSLVCTVKSYDTDTKTCYCIPINNDADIQQVRINPQSNLDGFIIFPKLNSLVLVSFLSDSSAYIAMFSEVDEVHLAGAEYGGIVKVENLTSKLNNIENNINNLITAITAWVPVPSDGGAALKVALTAWLTSSLTPTVRGNLENLVVKHGSGD